MMVLNCKKIGFINGCFDILHPGHLKMIQYCRKYCDYLIVGIDSDRMVKKSKGTLRPFNNEKDRKFFLENIKGVDKVFIFNSHKLLKEKLKNSKFVVHTYSGEFFPLYKNDNKKRIRYVDEYQAYD